jgi:hypothetical protein
VTIGRFPRPEPAMELSSMRLSLLAVVVTAPFALAVACGGGAPPANAPAGSPSTDASASSSTASSSSASETPAPTPTTTPTASPTVTPTSKPTAAPAEPGKTVSLSPLGGKAVTVKVGTKIEYSYKSHPSVGYAATQAVDGAGVVKFLRNDIKLDRPAPAGGVVAPGGDGGTGTFVFEAVGKGKATITIEEQFRGKTEHASTFTITVE